MIKKGTWGAVIYVVMSSLWASCNLSEIRRSNFHLAGKGERKVEESEKENSRVRGREGEKGLVQVHLHICLKAQTPPGPRTTNPEISM